MNQIELVRSKRMSRRNLKIKRKLGTSLKRLAWLSFCRGAIVSYGVEGIESTHVGGVD